MCVRLRLALHYLVKPPSIFANHLADLTLSFLPLGYLSFKTLRESDPLLVRKIKVVEPPSAVRRESIQVSLVKPNWNLVRDSSE